MRGKSLRQRPGPSAPPIAAGDIWHDKYGVVQVIGRGGMGIVVGARHLRLDEPVAIKLLWPEMATDEAIVARFLREARWAAKMKSDYVARIHDVDITPSGLPYIVMEWLEGRDLASICRETKTLDVTFAARCVIDACEAVAAAHALGIVHRDLKPANLFLTRAPDGTERVKVLDFGISKQSDALAVDGDEKTQTGLMLGTIEYMAPEQIRASSCVDARADLWSLGVTLYRLITGRLPFHGSSLGETSSLVLGAEPAPPSAIRPGLPRELDAVIARCLEKRPEQRFACARELASALAPFAGRASREPADDSSLSNERTRVVRKNATPAASSRSRLYRGLFFGVVALAFAAALIVGLSGVALSYREARRAAGSLGPAPTAFMDAGNATLDPAATSAAPTAPTAPTANASATGSPLVVVDSRGPDPPASAGSPPARSGATPRAKQVTPAPKSSSAQPRPADAPSASPVPDSPTARAPPERPHKDLLEEF